jgi:hypothetical protein
VDPYKPAKIVKEALERAVEKVIELTTPAIPGAPASEPPPVEQPTQPREPLPRKSDQASPSTVTPTGVPSGAPPEAVGQQEEYLTTAQGARLSDTDHSLKAGERGPVLLQDHHLREKIMHFDHERIPERVVHARGTAAHGVFVGYGTVAKVCKADFLGKGTETPVFVRFSTVVGSRGSADAVRDTRGFATKFYTEQGTFDLVGNNIPVFFHPGHLVPGIDVTDDPLLHARLFSYLDTQLTRLGGPNFGQIPINRPHAPVNDMLRDGFHQDAVHAGAAPYKPNSLDGGCPFLAGGDAGAYIEVPQPVAKSTKVRRSPASFDDHFTQPRLFYKSLSAVEGEHLVRAFTFELGKRYEQAIKERELMILANVDSELCAEVAAGLGLPAPKPSRTPRKIMPSPALSQLGRTWPVDGRIVGIVVDPAQLAGVRQIRDAVSGAGMVPLLVAPRGGVLDGELVAQRTFLTARSVEFDVLLLAAAPPPAADASGDAKAGNPEHPSSVDPRVVLMVQECFRHAKAIGAWGTGTAALDAAGRTATDPGIVVDDDPDTVLKQVTTLLGSHRVWDRFPPSNA